MGKTKTKRLLRRHFWFPSMNDLIDKEIDKCSACSVNDKIIKTFKTTIEPIQYPKDLWELI
ncbi:hypothetical protein A3Q56_08674, partial [Intoshia linei]